LFAAKRRSFVIAESSDFMERGPLLGMYNGSTFTGRGRADDHLNHCKPSAAAVQCNGGLSHAGRREVFREQRRSPGAVCKDRRTATATLTRRDQCHHDAVPRQGD